MKLSQVVVRWMSVILDVKEAHNYLVVIEFNSYNHLIELVFRDQRYQKIDI